MRIPFRLAQAMMVCHPAAFGKLNFYVPYWFPMCGI
jgi:hypothetical protein